MKPLAPLAVTAVAALLLSLPTRAQEGQLSVPLPEAFPTWSGADRVSFFALVGDKLAEGMVGDASVLFEVPAVDSDRVLLLGGAHARWAHRGADGIWTWDAAGLVVAGKLPAKFEEAYVDVLKPLDGQVAPPFDALYPTFNAVTFDQGFFVLGVPAAGRYDLILETDGGKTRVLATVAAVSEQGLDKNTLPAVTTRPAEFRLALTPPGKLGKTAPIVSLREYYRHMKLDASAPSKKVGATLEVPVDPRVLGGRVWAWAPGWCAVRVQGSEFSEQQPAVARTVEPGRKLLVRVRDHEGRAFERACIELRDAEGKPLVAAFAPRGVETEAALESVGRVSSDGDLTIFGLPAGGVKLLIGPCGPGQDRITLTWDGKQDVLDVVYE